MGRPIARNLANAGISLSVFDVNNEVARKFCAEFPARHGSSAADVSEGADVVITIVPTSAVVEQTVFGPQGMASTAVKPRLLIDMTSGQPQVTRDIGRRLGDMGIGMIDAPVSGGVARATRGDLAIMVGGKKADIDSCKYVLEHIGQTPVHVGSLGAGQALKALNNMSSAAGLLIASEVVWVAQRFGLDPQRVVEVINSSSGMNNSTKTKVKEHILSGSYASGFGLDLMVKDLGIALEIGTGLNAEMPLSKACFDLWVSAQKTLGPGRDHTEIARASATLAGVESQS